MHVRLTCMQEESIAALFFYLIDKIAGLTRAELCEMFYTIFYKRTHTNINKG